MKLLKFRNILFILALLSSCNIDRMPENVVSDASFWKSESDLKAAANYLYTFLPTMPLTADNMSDDGFAMVANEISSGTWQPPATSSDFTTPYQLIRAANNIIEKSVNAVAAGVVPETVDRYIAEAKFFRAWGYFSLVQRYGDVPLIKTTLKEDAAELTAAKSPREEVVSLIYSDLSEAAAILPTPTALGAGSNYGRISKTAALAFKARVALYEGTRAKFHSYGNPTAHLTIAVQAAKAVMESGEHDLFSNYFDLFQYAGKGRQNRENILVRQYGSSMTDQILSHNIGVIINGACNPTRSLVDAYLMKDGLPIDKSPLYVAPTRHSEIFVNRDARLAASVMKEGDQYFQNTPYTFPQLVYQTTGFCYRKFVNAADQLPPNNNQSFIDLPVIRYAEVLLTYAEATYELNGNITDADLKISINLLRARASLPDLTNAFVADHSLSMREEIRRERRVELAMEGFRYWDIIRWKIAETVLPKPILGCYFFPGGFGTATPQLTADNYILAQSGASRSFNSQRDYLWPFPVNELALNPNLVQNPNW